MFPSPSLVPPALTVAQINFGGLTFGGIEAGATYQLQSIEGLDGVDVVSGDQQRAQEEGEFAGLDVLPGRDLIIKHLVSGISLAALAAARRRLGGVFAVKGSEETPLWVMTEDELVFGCMARPRRHHFPYDVNVFVAEGVLVTSQVHTTDPRWYAAPSKTATVGIPGPLGGVSFPIVFPVSFGGGASGGVLEVENAGTMEMRPVLVITGPCVNPSVSNITIPGAPRLTFNVTLNVGDQLIIDTDFQTVQLVAAGTAIAESRRNAVRAGSVWWNLPKEETCQIEFTTEDTSAVAATLTVQSADAYASL